MEVHKPKHALRSWREFLSEVGIIVLGVLIALGAEQTAERLTWRHRVNEAREDLRKELETVLFCAQERVRRKECIERMLGRWNELIDHPPSTASKLHVSHDLRPWPSAAWDSAIASGAVSHMAVDERLRFAEIYGFVPEVRAMNVEEFTTGTQLGMVERGGPISEVTQDRLRATVAKLHGYNSMLALGAKQLSDMIDGLGIKLSPENETYLNNNTCPMPDEPTPATPISGK